MAFTNKLIALHCSQSDFRAVLQDFFEIEANSHAKLLRNLGNLHGNPQEETKAQYRGSFGAKGSIPRLF